MATWLLSEEVFESNRHFDDRQSWARQSGEHFVGQFKSELFVDSGEELDSFEHLQRVWLHLHQGRAAVALLMDS